MGIPMTAKEQLLLAREHGHELYVETRGEKSWVGCSCGYRSVARRSKSAVNGTLAWHMSNVLAEALSKPEARRNGVGT